MQQREVGDSEAASPGDEPDRTIPRLAFDCPPGGWALRLKQLRVASILDDFSYAGFRHECDLLQVTPDAWQTELEAFRPEMLIVESAWRGKDMLWQGRVAKFDPALAGILAWCGKHLVPTVFWNKEDPIHFRTFKRIAKRFDYVFTTDIDCIAPYQAGLGHDRVFLLPFACQPLANNPIERGPRRKNAFAFAGGYYARYPERQRDFAEIIGALARLRPVEIFDRGQGATDERYRFPEEYERMIVGTLPFEQIDIAYKGYRYGVNLNSIKQSQSMFARRVFELLASNTLTISNYSRGLRLMFGDLVVDSDDGDAILRRLMTIAAETGSADKLRLAGLRKVMAEHTAQDRLAYIVSKVAGVPIVATPPTMTMVGRAEDAAGRCALIEAYRRQTYRGRRLLLITDIDRAAEELPGAHVVTAAEADGLDLPSLVGADGWIAPIVAGDYYGPNYLTDLALATRYAPGNAIGKAAHFTRDETGRIRLIDSDARYRIVDRVPARAGAVKASALSAPVSLGRTDLENLALDEPRTLAIDPFNYCRNAGFGDRSVVATVDDLDGIDPGFDHDEMTAIAEGIRLVPRSSAGLPRLAGGDLAALFKSGTLISFSADSGRLRIDSSLAPQQRRRRYTQSALPPERLGVTEGILRAHMVAESSTLELGSSFRFLDGDGAVIGTAVSIANRDMEIDLPEGTAGIQIGVRLIGPGTGHVSALILGHCLFQPSLVLSRGDCLVLTDTFPSESDPDAGGDAWQAATGAIAAGRRADVFRLADVETTTYEDFRGVECITGDEAALEALIAAGRHREVVVTATVPEVRSRLMPFAARFAARP
ncbi:MAG: glycosyltransferase [Bauldia sp.]|nr:glycosyltransferase [Bauldia sp.]